MMRVGKIEDDARVGLSTTAIGEFLAEVDRAVEAQASVVVNVNVQRFEVSWSVDDSNLAGLYEVVYINQKRARPQRVRYLTCHH